MDEDAKKLIDELKTEIMGLKIRIRRLEEFYNAFPNPSDYVHVNSEEKLYDPTERDELFEQAVRMISQHSKASVSLIQRRLQIGFNRAARLLEQLENAGAIGQANGPEPRDVLIKNADEFLKGLEEKS